MDGRILETYGSCTGSTAEIESAIADALRTRGFVVTLLRPDQLHGTTSR